MGQLKNSGQLLNNTVKGAISITINRLINKVISFLALDFQIEDSLRFSLSDIKKDDIRIVFQGGKYSDYDMRLG